MMKSPSTTDTTDTPEVKDTDTAEVKDTDTAEPAGPDHVASFTAAIDTAITAATENLGEHEGFDLATAVAAPASALGTAVATLRSIPKGKRAGVVADALAPWHAKCAALRAAKDASAAFLIMAISDADRACDVVSSEPVTKAVKVTDPRTACAGALATLAASAVWLAEVTDPTIFAGAWEAVAGADSDAFLALVNASAFQRIAASLVKGKTSTKASGTGGNGGVRTGSGKTPPAGYNATTAHALEVLTREGKPMRAGHIANASSSYFPNGMASPGGMGDYAGSKADKLPATLKAVQVDGANGLALV